MKARSVFAITKKDLLEVRQNQAAWMPMLIVPLIFVIIMPLAFILIPQQLDLTATSLTQEFDLEFFLEKMPPSIAQHVEWRTELQSIIVIMLGYIFAPFFLIMPLMFSTIIGAESFAGEKERKTLEALLYTPASDAELFTGKVLAAFLPSLIVTWGCFLVYILVINIAGYPVFGAIWFPLPNWWALIFWVAPALTVLGISVSVLISAKVQTFMGAYQLSGSLVILVVALIGAQISGVLYLSTLVSLILGLVIWLVDALLMRLSVRSFNRRTLLMQPS